MKKCCFLFILFNILFFTESSAQYPVIRNFNRKTTNAGTQNWDIIQHNNNWMYFANNNGLLEFDGNKWSLYPIANWTTVRSLCYDEVSDRIYAGAFNEFGYYSRDDMGILKYHSLLDLLDEEKRNFNEIWKIYKSDDAVFFQGVYEVFRFKNNEIRTYHLPEKIDQSAVVHELFIVSTPNEGALVLNGNMFIQLPNSEILKNKKICSILPLDDKKILFVTDFNGLYVFDGEKVSRFKTDIDEFLHENQVFCANIRNNKLALGTVRNGLVVKNLTDDSNIFSNINTGLQNNTILSIEFDIEENLWLGLDKGIDYVMIKSAVYDLFGNNQSYGTGYASLVKDDILYLGTNQGLYYTKYPISNSSKPMQVELVPNMQGQVWSLKLIDDLVFCGTDHGAFIINGNRSRKISQSGTWDFIELNNYPNFILGSSYQGFFLLKKQGEDWVFSNFIDGIEESGGMFDEDEQGNIWYAHWMKGIFKLNFNEDMTVFSVESFDSKRGFYVDRNNTLFKLNNKIIFSSDGGFFEYSKEENKVVHEKYIESIFGQHPYSMILTESGNGDIWAVYGNTLKVAGLQKDGTYRVKKTPFSFLNSKLIPGFSHFNFLNDSTLMINTEDGFSLIDLSKLENPTHLQAKVAIRQIYLTNEQDSIVGGYINEQNIVPKFKHKKNSIRFEFTAPDYTDENTIVYSCRLNDYDIDWSGFSDINTKEYTKLPKGDYIFKVKAKNILEDEIVETAFHFTILPPWYETWLAIIVYILILIFLFIQLLLFINRRTEMAAKKMEIKKEEELKVQKAQFDADTKEKEKEIVELKNQRLKYDLRHKSQELANSTMNLIRKNEILLEINQNLVKISDDIRTQKPPTEITKNLSRIQNNIKKNIEYDDNWKKFEANFDIVYENYLKRLGESYPILSVSDKKLCAYLKMGLSSKDIAPLLNMSYRSVEMSRYRLRKKLDLSRDTNLTEFLQNF